MNYPLHEGCPPQDELYHYHLTKLLEANLESYAQKLFPGGHARNGSYGIGRYDLYTDPQGFRFGEWVYTQDGNYSYPYQQPERTCGKGLIDLYAHVWGINNKDAMYRIAKELDLPLQLDGLLCKQFLPLESAERLIEFSSTKDVLPCHPVFAALGSSSPLLTVYYRSIDNRCFCVTQIYQHGGKRYFIPASAWIDSITGRRAFKHLASLPPYPLLNLPTLKRLPTASILLVSDEYAAYSLIKNFSGVTGGAIVTTWSCGNKAMISDVDWSPIADRSIFILADYSKKGYRKAHHVYKALVDAGAKSIRFISNKEFHALPPDHDHGEHDRAMAITLHETYVEERTLDYNQFLREANSYVQAGFDCRSNLHAITLTEFWATQAPDAEWALPGLIHIKDRVLIFAPKGVGKTWFATILYLCMAGGRGFPNIYEEAGKPQNVLVFDGENPKRDLDSRTLGLVPGLGLSKTVGDRIRIESAALLGAAVDLSREENRARSQEALNWANVIVLDNLNSIWSESLQAGPESSAELNSVINNLALQGKTVIIINHASRKGTSFGSSTKEFGMETVIKLSKAPLIDGNETFKAEFAARWTPGLPSRTLTLVPDGNAIRVEIDMKSESKNAHPSLLDTDEAILAQEMDIEVDGMPDSLSEDDPQASGPTPQAEGGPTPTDKLILELYQQGKSFREIAAVTKGKESEGLLEIKAVSKSTVENRVKKFKKEGLIPS